MTNEQIMAIQYSPKPKGERELIERIIREWEPELWKIAASISVPLLDADDIGQQLRLVVWRCIEDFWPGGNFKGYVMRALSNEKNNILKWAKARKRNPEFPVLSLELILDEETEDNALAVLRDDTVFVEEPWTHWETDFLFRQLEEALRREGRERIAQAIGLLRQGKSPGQVAALLDFNTVTEMEHRIVVWGRQVAEKINLQAEDLLS